MSRRLPWLTGLYAVLDRDDDDLCAALVDPARGGARVIQLRIKPSLAGASGPTQLTQQLLAAALRARAVTSRYGARLIINDRLDLALACGADGVHLGQDDLPIGAARAVLAQANSGMVLGLSTHDLAQVASARTAGVDYIGFGPVFPTATKAHHDPVVGLDGLGAAVRVAEDLPVVAIGGIQVANVAAVAAQGCRAACLISAVINTGNPAAAARQVNACFG